MALKIGVFIKSTPDTNSRVILKGDAVDEADLKYVINPYDEFAIEEAIKTKELWTKAGETVEIVGIGLGPQTAQKALRDALAVGVDRAIHILDPEKKAGDSLSVAEALAEVAKAEGFHLIFAGKQAVDTDSHSVATMVAEILNIPSMGVVSKCEWTGSSEVRVERDIEGGSKEIYSIKLPCLLTANKGLNKMRLASLPGIRAASKKELKEVPVSSGLQKRYQISNWSLPPDRGQVKMISGEASEQAAELVRLLHEVSKVV